MTHQLKTLPEYWDAIQRGDKTFEVRKDDRDFVVGDNLVLVRLVPVREGSAVYSVPNDPATIIRRIRYILHGGQFGIEAGYVVMGLEEIS